MNDIETTITVFCRIAGRLARWQVMTDSHGAAIAAVKTEMARQRIDPEGAVLALIQGGAA